MKTLKEKIDFAIKLIQSAAAKAKEVGQPIEVCYSGGKDSDVILELVRMAKVEYRAIYKNTTIDPPGTIKHCRERGVEIMKPKYSFGKIIQKTGFPSRYKRICCAYLKEYKILNYTILGIRSEESNKRKERYKEPERCRVFNKKEKTRQYFPILNWTKKDVEDFVKERNIKLHPLYYDNKGNFISERRLGCMCCPLASKKNRILEFMKYPNMIKYYINNGQKYLDKHPKSKINEYFNDAYEWLFFSLHYDSIAEFNEFMKENIFGEKFDCKKYLSERFNVKFGDNEKKRDNSNGDD